MATPVLALVGVVLVSLNLRTAVTSLSPLLGVIDAEIGLGAGDLRHLGLERAFGQGGEVGEAEIGGKGHGASVRGAADEGYVEPRRRRHQRSSTCRHACA